MAYIFLGFILLWYILVTLAVKFMTVSVLEGVGLGTAGGVFLGAFKDMWQFLWRKASPEEQTKAGNGRSS
jgi:hypothetical protein